MSRFRTAMVASACALSVLCPVGQPTAHADEAVTIAESKAALPTDSHPSQMAVGPDGNLWFANFTGIGKLNPSSGVITVFTVGLPAGAIVVSLTAGPDGNLWFTDTSRPEIGRITPSGVITLFPAGAASGNYAIAAGPDGNLWFTELSSGNIGRITPSGVATEFPSRFASGALAIVAGPDGNLWYAGADNIGRITPAGVVTDFSTPANGTLLAARMTVGPDGAIWFTTFQDNIGRITMAGVETVFDAGMTSLDEPVGIITGPDGALWYTEYASNRIGRITTDGVATAYTSGISHGAGPQEITTGPDGHLWFTESQRPGLASIDLSGAPPLRAITRIEGVDRDSTAIAISARDYPVAHSAPGVVLARAANYPDALAGAPLAVQLNAPLLLTGQPGLSLDTDLEIARVLPAGGTVTLLGGEDAISPGVTSRLQSEGYTVVRDAGPNRFATAVAIASAISTPTAVLLADGQGFGDALSAGAAAAHIGGVVLLTDGPILAPETASYLSAHPALPVYAIGGPAALAAPTAKALVGADRYATSVAVAKQFFSSPTVAGLASGQNFPDALAGDVANGKVGAPMLLSANLSLPAPVLSYLSASPSIVNLTVYGGTHALSAGVATTAGG